MTDSAQVKITRRTRTVPLDELDRVLQALEAAGVNLPAEHAGYSRQAISEWRNAGAVPLRAIYALKGVLAEAPAQTDGQITFTDDELFSIASQLPRGNPARKKIFQHFLRKESI